MPNKQNSCANPLYFGFILGCFLAVYVIIGSFASYYAPIRIEIVKKIADMYVIPTARVDFFSLCQKILSGVFWAFADGCIVGASFFWLYQKLDGFIHHH